MRIWYGLLDCLVKLFVSDAQAACAFQLVGRQGRVEQIAEIVVPLGCQSNFLVINSLSLICNSRDSLLNTNFSVIIGQDSKLYFQVVRKCYFIQRVLTQWRRYRYAGHIVGIAYIHDCILRHGFPLRLIPQIEIAHVDIACRLRVKAVK